MANVLGTLFGDIANAIREKSGESGTMKPAEFPAKIAAIPAGGGGSAAGAVAVTFCNYNGTELYSRQVFIGDDCPDPVAQRKIDAPTRGSTAQYKYTHNGWSTTAGGAADANALKNITSDKTVYAAFKETVRMYTVRFLDGDTVMKTEQVAYGSKATPPSTVKDGYSFEGWTPSNLTIYGDTDFVGTWEVDAGWLAILEFPTDAIPYSGSLNSPVGEYTPDGSKLFVGYSDTLYMFDSSVQPYVLLNTFKPKSGSAIKYISVSNSLVAVSITASTTKLRDVLYVYSIEQNKLVNRTFAAKTSSSTIRELPIGFSPDGNTLCCYLGYLINTSNPTQTMPVTEVNISGGSPMYTSDGEKLIMGKNIYSVQNGYEEEDASLTFGNYSFVSSRKSITRDGRYIAFTGITTDSSRGGVWIFDTTTTPYTLVKRFDYGKNGSNTISGTSISFSPDGSLLAVGLSEGSISPHMKVYDVGTWEEKDEPLVPPDDDPQVVLFNNDGTRLFVLGNGISNGLVRLYKVNQ